MHLPRILRRRQRDEELARDLKFYLDTETDENIARGMTPEDARAAAYRKLGNTGMIREDVYLMRAPGLFGGIAVLEPVVQDVSYALRTLLKSRAFALTAVLTLALGIGGNTAMFTVIRDVLLKPLAYRAPDRLVYLDTAGPGSLEHDRSFLQSEFEEIRQTAQSFSGFGAFLRVPENLTLSGSGDPAALRGARVSANFLDILGVEPLLGRSFLPQEDRPEGSPVAMISSGLWRRRFGGDPHIEGKTIVLGSTPHTIVGVLPAGFAFPFPGIDVWVTKPSEWSALPSRYWRFVTPLIGFGRLKRGVTFAQARSEVEVLDHQYAASHPPAKAEIWLTGMKEELVRGIRPALWMLWGAVGFVLLISCANVASLLLARAGLRSREFAVRAALGAGRSRLVRQLLAESMVLAFAGGAAGAALSYFALRAISGLTQVSGASADGSLLMPRMGEIHIDAWALAFTAALSILTGILFGVVPALTSSRTDLIRTLREQGTAQRIGRPNSRALLVIGQVALSVVLLIGAALLLTSLARLRDVNTGFQPANLLTMKISLPPARYGTDEKKATFFEHLIEKARAVPGVGGAAVALSLPTVAQLSTNVRVEGQPAIPANRPQIIVAAQSVSPGYFRTLGIPLRRGREFTTKDNAPDAPPVAIVNESFARQFWPAYPNGPDPVGRHLWEGVNSKIPWLEIVGVVADVREHGPASAAASEFYIPSRLYPPQTAYLAIRTRGNPLQFTNAVRKEVLAVDQDQPISDVRTMEQRMDALAGPQRLTMWLLGIFAGIALLLAVLGIYGLISYSVEQRRQEVGIRRALGAQQGDILRLVVKRGLILTLAGVAVGVGGALALTRVLKGLLFEVSPTDPTAFISIALLFALVALGASYLPARRAARIDPMSALRVL